MIIYDKTTQVYLNDRRHLFGSVRFINNEIITTTPPYKDAIDYTNVHLSFIYNNQIYDLSQSYYIHHAIGESIIIIKYTHPILANISNIELIYKYTNSKSPVEGKIELYKENRKSYNLASMTLFKDDYELMDAYVRHYIALGVEVMYLYANIAITPEVKAMIKDKLSFATVDIYIVEHNLQYWDSRVLNTAHSAQSIAINDFIYLSKGLYTHVLLNDFDEYIYLYKNLSLEKGTSYIFQNRFSSVANIAYTKMQNIITSSKYIMAYKPYGPEGRTKAIHDPLTIDVVGVHHSHICSANKHILDPHNEGFHAHCIDYSNRNRLGYFIKPDDNSPEKIILARSKKFIPYTP